MDATQEKPKKSNLPKYAHEFFELINEADGLQKVEMMRKYGNNPPINFLLSMNFNKKVVFDLPEGMPPYKRSEDIHPDLFSPLGSQIKRMQNCMKIPATAQISKMKKEFIFQQLLEVINPEEADVLVACKDRKLTELYPNITEELVSVVHPHLIGVSAK
jgi:hypothetical protein